jgi:cytochrome P450 / NADPH-cytochrome P450 reductase
LNNFQTTVTLASTGPSTLPIGKPVSLREVLSGYVEFSQPATHRNLETLLSFADEAEKAIVQSLIDGYKDIVNAKRLSVLDILVANPSIKVPLNVFLTMLPAMRIRQYSISSSPLWNPSRVTLTVSVVEAPALSGSGEIFQGVGSNYLASLQPGDLVQVAVRTSAAAFSLPTSPSVPLILFCAGSGLAPMRGFIQERAMQVKAGRSDVGKVLLFFGCRDPEKDYLYSDSDLEEWTELGVVDIRPAFSKAKELSGGCTYVQE